jgi:hypothetical protein
MGAAAQVGMIGGSLGGGKIDQGCDSRELARSFSGPQTIASCKILINTKKAKAAHVTMEDCLDVPPAPEPIAPVAPIVPVVPIVPIVPVQIVPPPPPSINVTVPVTIVVPPTPAPTLVKPVKKPVRHMTPACQNGMELRCVVKR